MLQVDILEIFEDVGVRVDYLMMLLIFIGIVATAVLIIEVAILIKRKRTKNVADS